MKKITMVMTLALIVSAVSFAAGIQEEHPVHAVETAEEVAATQVAVEVDLDDPSGREVANIGVQGVLKGVMHRDKDEWYLKTDDQLYELHMGVIGHNSPDMFKAGSAAVVTGFIYKNHVAPILVETEQRSEQFWREDRFPIWAGGGGSKNQVEYPGERGEPTRLEIGK